jgi:hypothetical protein
VTLGVLQLLANHYPERLFKAYVVNAPSIFQMAWKVGCDRLPARWSCV